MLESISSVNSLNAKPYESMTLVDELTMTKVYYESYLLIGSLNYISVHSAPGAHNSAVERTIFGNVRPRCGRFFSPFSCINIKECIDKFLGTQFGIMCA